MMKKSKNPRIRFKGFTDDWEQRKLSEITAEFKSGENIKSNELENFGTYPVYGGNGLRGYSEHYNHDGEYALIGRQGALCGNMNYSTGKAYFTEHAVAVSENYYSNTRFLYYLLLKMDLGKYSDQSAQPGLAVNKLIKLYTYVPERNEQVEIALLLKKIDELITLHQRKLEKLELMKKSLLQKMFPKSGNVNPKIRFKGYTDDWEQRKLGNIAKFINGRAYSQEELLNSGKYKVLRVGNFYTNDSWYYSNLELDDKYYANDGDLLYTWSATFGPHIWHGERVIYHYHIWKVDLSNELDIHFLVHLLEQDKSYILLGHNGSTMVHITKVGMEQKEVIIPQCIEEQKQLGLLFDSLDSLITLHQRKLEKLKLLKKTLLQDMFPSE